MELGLLPIATNLANRLSSGITQVIAGGSSFAQVLAGLGPATPKESSAAGATITGSPAIRLSPAEQQTLDKFRTLLEQKLAERGISLGNRLSLGKDVLGEIQAGEDHPDARAIQQTIADDPELSQLASQLLGGDSLASGEYGSAAPASWNPADLKSGRQIVLAGEQSTIVAVVK